MVNLDVTFFIDFSKSFIYKLKWSLPLDRQMRHNKIIEGFEKSLENVTPDLPIIITDSK